MGKLSRRYVRQVLQHARDKDGRLTLVYVGRSGGGGGSAEAPKDPWDLTRRVLTLRGYPPHRVERKVQELKAQQQAYQQAAQNAVQEAQAAARRLQAEVMRTMQGR